MKTKTYRTFEFDGQTAAVCYAGGTTVLSPVALRARLVVEEARRVEPATDDEAAWGELLLRSGGTRWVLVVS